MTMAAFTGHAQLGEHVCVELGLSDETYMLEIHKILTQSLVNVLTLFTDYRWLMVAIL